MTKTSLPLARPPIKKTVTQANLPFLLRLLGTQTLKRTSPPVAKRPQLATARANGTSKGSQLSRQVAFDGDDF